MAGSVHGPIVLWLAVALVGVYGGYFGAAQGVLLIAILGIGLAEPLLKINAIKNVLATIANAIASVVFIIVSEVNWPAAIAIAVGSVLGAQVGGRVGRKLPAIDLSGDHRGCRHRCDCQSGELSANGKTSAYGRLAADRPGMAILLPRIPLPTTIMSSSATASSTRIGQLAGRPMGVMPPYSMPVSRTASSIPAKEILRTSSRFLITRLTSALSVARTRHAAIMDMSARRPATTTQLAETSNGTSYAAQNAAVSAWLGSMGATKHSSPRSAMASLTGRAKSSEWSSAGCQSKVPTICMRGGS